MSCDRDKRSCLHHNVFPMEDPLPSIVVNNSVLLRINQELGGQRDLEEKQQKQEAGASHSDEL